MASKAIYSVVAVIGIGAASGAAWWYQNRPFSSSADSRPAPAPAAASNGAAAGSRVPTVETARVAVARLTDDAQAVGSLRSRQSVVLRPEVSGRVTQINFRDGERVRHGQLLVQLDDQLPLAQVQQAQAELSIARANHKRNQELVAQNFISQRSVDESAANLQVAEAKLALAQATAARLRILAPFDGIAGIRGVNVGDYLKDGADIVNIEDLEAVYLDFRLPERFQTKIMKGQVALVDIDALPGRHFSAVVQAIDPLVDANGRSIGVRGCIDNRQLALRPGMFARVTVVFGERPEARVLPEEAIVPQGGRMYVHRLLDDAKSGAKTTQRVEVKVGLRRPGQVEIVEGLDPGDVIVTAGQQRIQRDGTAVRVVELGQPPQQGAARDGRPANAAGSPASGTASASPKTPSNPTMPGRDGRRAAVPQPLNAAGPNPCSIDTVKAAAARQGLESRSEGAGR